MSELLPTLLFFATLTMQHCKAAVPYNHFSLSCLVVAFAFPMVPNLAVSEQGPVGEAWHKLEAAWLQSCCHTTTVGYHTPKVWACSWRFCRCTETVKCAR